MWSCLTRALAAIVPGNPVRIATEAFFINPGLLRLLLGLGNPVSESGILATAAKVEASQHGRQAGRKHLGDEAGDISRSARSPWKSSSRGLGDYHTMDTQHPEMKNPRT